MHVDSLCWLFLWSLIKLNFHCTCMFTLPRAHPTYLLTYLCWMHPRQQVLKRQSSLYVKSNNYIKLLQDYTLLWSEIWVWLLRQARVSRQLYIPDTMFIICYSRNEWKPIRLWFESISTLLVDYSILMLSQELLRFSTICLRM